MAIVSDANILSSLASADALDLLYLVFKANDIFIPIAVKDELEVGLNYGQTHLKRIFQAIESGNIQIISLTKTEQTLMEQLSQKLHAGEREGIILCQTRNYIFLSNDKRAIRYCQANKIKTVNLEAFLRSVWIYRIRSTADVRYIIKQMERVEGLVLKSEQLDNIFANRPP